jgi:hypothetical protein
MPGTLEVLVLHTADAPALPILLLMEATSPLPILEGTWQCLAVCSEQGNPVGTFTPHSSCGISVGSHLWESQQVVEFNNPSR